MNPQATTPSELMLELGRLIRSLQAGKGPIVVGITGIDTSGKSRLAIALAAHLRGEGVHCTLVHADDFHRPRAERYVTGLPEPEQYYHHSIDFGRLADDVLNPLRSQGQLATHLRLLDLPSDTWDLERSYEVPPNGVVLLEGVFLFREETRDHLDLAIYLHVDEAVVLQRAEIRDVPDQGQDVMRRYHEKYLPAQRAYLAAHPPARHADVVVDNSRWQAPIVTMWPGAETKTPS